MPRVIHALLVGIDEYPSPIPKLQGCVNDIDAFATYLSERVGQGQGRRAQSADAQERRGHPPGGHRRLPRPPRQGRRRGRRALLLQRPRLAGAGPRGVLEARAGPPRRDARLRRQPEPGELGPGRQGNRQADRRGRREGAARRRDPRLLPLRLGDPRRSETVVRRAPTDLRRRPIESFIVSPAEAGAAAGRDVGASNAGWYASPEGRHVLFAACRDDEEAKEYIGDGKHRGAFSFFLGDALKSAAGVPTYRDLFARASALVSSQVAEPVAPARGDPERRPRRHLPRRRDPAVARHVHRELRRAVAGSINGGATNGIPAPAGSDAARLALFPFDAPADVLARPGQGRGDGQGRGRPPRRPAGSRSRATSPSTRS